MIALSRLNKEQFVLNAEYIETIEETPDTVITLTSGKKLMVREKIDNVVKQVIEYHRLCNQSIQVIRKEKES
jgi:flagellar protein FlbD